MQTIIQIIGITAGVLTSTSFIPQLIKIIKTKEAEDVSLFMMITRVTGLVLWIVYGIVKSDIPVLATNAFSCAVSATIIFFMIKYAKNQKK